MLLSEQYYFLLSSNYFAGQPRYVTPNANIVNVHCYSCQVEKQFYPMKGELGLTVIVSAKRFECRDRRSFISDELLVSELFSLIYMQ